MQGELFECVESTKKYTGNDLKIAVTVNKVSLYQSIT